MEFLIFLVHLHSMVRGQRLDVSYGTVAHELAVIQSFETLRLFANRF